MTATMYRVALQGLCTLTTSMMPRVADNECALDLDRYTIHGIGSGYKGGFVRLACPPNVLRALM